MVLWMNDFIAGWTGGIFSLLIGHPFDTIKVRQQTMGGLGLIKAASRTYRYEGIRGFYKGLLFPLLTVGPANSIFFGVYGNVLTHLNSRSAQRHIAMDDFMEFQKVFWAGFVAGCAQIIFMAPCELVKTTLQAQVAEQAHWKVTYKVPYKGSIDAFFGILKSKGVLGLYRGFTPMWIRDVPAFGLYTLTYEMLLYSRFYHCNTPRMVKQMVAGGTAGIMSWIFVIPFDVVKSRMQADDPNHPQYKGFIDCMRKTYEHGGFKIFFRGLPAVVIRAFPVNAATFLGYEEVLRTLKKIDEA